MRGFRSCMVLAAGVAVCASVALAPPAVADAPGVLISTASRPDDWHGIPGGSVIEYWMSGSDGSPQPASGALFIPPGPQPAGGWPILAFTHGTTGLGAGCAAKSNPETAYSDHFILEEDDMMRRAVARGFAVAAPDYLGLGRFDTGPHPYLELRTEATATIDMVRAVRSAHPELSRTWAVMGPSQGGQAALGTGHLQSTYAPELDFRGTIAIDPESDVEKLLPIAGPIIPVIPGADGITGFFTEILAGLRAARPDAGVNDYLSPLGRSVLDEVGTWCKPRIEARVNDLSIGDLLSKPLSDNALRAAYESYLTVPVSGYDAPILLLLNVTDIMVPSPLHATLAAQFAANGVDFSTVTGTGTHTQLNPAMLVAIDNFLTEINNHPAN